MPRTSETWKRSQPRASNGTISSVQRKFVIPSSRSPALNTSPLPLTTFCA